MTIFTSISPVSLLERLLLPISNPQSTKAVASAMAEQVNDIPGAILQVGVGKGEITAELAQPGRLLVAIECDQRRAKAVASQNPEVKMAVCDLRVAPCVLRDMEIEPVRAVVSGLRLESQDEEELERTVWAISQCLRPGGRWIQASATSKGPVPASMLEKQGLVEVREGLIPDARDTWLFSYMKV